MPAVVMAWGTARETLGGGLWLEDTREEAMDVTIAGFRVFLDCLNDVKEMGIISATDVTDIGDIKEKPEMKIAYQMGKNI